MKENSCQHQRSLGKQGGQDWLLGKEHLSWDLKDEDKLAILHVWGGRKPVSSQPHSLSSPSCFCGRIHSSCSYCLSLPRVCRRQVRPSPALLLVIAAFESKLQQISRGRQGSLSNQLIFFTFRHQFPSKFPHLLSEAWNVFNIGTSVEPTKRNKRLWKCKWVGELTH